MSLREDEDEENDMTGDAVDQQISFIQRDPFVKKLFEDAIKVLRLVGADENASVPLSIPQCQEAPVLTEKRKETLIQQKTEKQTEKPPKMTKLKRQKLERIKAPVTVFRKPQQEKVPTGEEQEIAVKKMLNYVSQMPSQETFHPPPLPLVLFSLDGASNEGDGSEDKPSSSERIQDCTYLSNEKDVSLWKMMIAFPNKRNVFVGGLSREVSSEILNAAFKTFIVDEGDKDKLKAHVVLDLKRQQSRGYGFVTFPNRRSTELALICMQEFEIYGHTMQLGWGQENREEQLLNGEDSISKEAQQQQQHALKLDKKKGKVFSDTVYLDDPSLKQSKRCSSRWDQEIPKKRFQRTGAEENMDQAGVTTDQSMMKVLEGQVSTNNNNRQPLFLNDAQGGRSSQIIRGLQWLTHDQKVALVKLACSNLRSQGVQGHLGVFGIHYEADNSRLYVVCAKHVTESQLHDEFSAFGSTQVKLNCDANGLSKGCAFIQFSDSKSAEKAIKQLHGKIVGGMPMKVMVAEPKVCRGSWTRKRTVQL